MAVLLVDWGGSPHYNLAFEEAVAVVVGRRGGPPVARVWVNPSSVVVGYSLRPCEEVDCGRAGELGVPVVRRFTGGGAVYHDLGNVNVTIAVPGRLHLDEVYKLGTGVVLDALRSMGVRAWVENEGDVVVAGWKVSGSAAAFKRGATLFHATLLVRADLRVARALLRPRLDRVRRGEVTPAKYKPENLSRLAGVEGVQAAAAELAWAALKALGAGAVVERCGPHAMRVVREAEALAVKLYYSKYSKPGWAIVGSPRLSAPSRTCLEAG